MAVTLMYHDDGCETWLDSSGRCPLCNVHPGMQSTAFDDMPMYIYILYKVKGRTFLGLNCEPK